MRTTSQSQAQPETISEKDEKRQPEKSTEIEEISNKVPTTAVTDKPASVPVQDAGKEMDSEVVVDTSPAQEETEKPTPTQQNDFSTNNPELPSISEQMTISSDHLNEAATDSQSENVQDQKQSSLAPASNPTATENLSETTIDIDSQNSVNLPEDIVSPVTVTQPVMKDVSFDECSSLFNADDVIDELLNLANGGGQIDILKNDDIIETQADDVIETQADDVIETQADDVGNSTEEHSAVSQSDDVNVSTSPQVSNDVIGQPTNSLQTGDVKLNFSNIIDDMLQLDAPNEPKKANADNESMVSSEVDAEIAKKPDQTNLRTMENSSQPNDRSDHQTKKPIVNGDTDTSNKDVNSISSTSDNDAEEANKRRSSMNGTYQIVSFSCSFYIF